MSTVGGFSPLDPVSWIRAANADLPLPYRRPSSQGADPSLPTLKGSLPPPPVTATDLRSALSDSNLPPDDTIGTVFPGVRSGTIIINGHSIAVSPTSTTLRDVLTALQSIPGLFASVDTVTGAVIVAGPSANDKLDIRDTTGLLRALGLRSAGLDSSDKASATDPTTPPATSVGDAAHEPRRSPAQVLPPDKGPAAFPLPPVELFEAVLAGQFVRGLTPNDKGDLPKPSSARDFGAHASAVSKYGASKQDKFGLWNDAPVAARHAPAMAAPAHTAARAYATVAAFGR